MLINPIYGYIAAGTALISFAAGWTVNGWRYKGREAKAVEMAMAQRDQANARANAISANYEIARMALNEANSQTEIKIRTVYRDRKVLPDCAIPAGAASLLNNARDTANAAITGKSGGTVPDDQANRAE